MSYKRFLTVFTVVVLVSLLLTGQALADKKGDTTRVSVSSSGGEGDDRSAGPSVSADGRYVVFPSFSALVSNDTNEVQDIFLRDTQTGTTTRVSVNSSGVQGNASSYAPDISADGRYVFFVSDANNLVAGDTNGRPDIFMRDLETNTTTRVSVSSNGGQANGVSFFPAVSPNGRYLAFFSGASNLVSGDMNGGGDIFLRDLTQGTTILVSVASDGTQVNDSVESPAVSDDGRYVVFTSLADTLVPGDTNQQADIFLRDTKTNQTTCLSVVPEGTQENGMSWTTSSDDDISGDGRYVVFGSVTTTVVGRDTNRVGNIFLRDLQTNTTTRVSVGMDGAQANDLSSSPLISADGRYVAFISAASNLVARDTNDQIDTFVYDTQTEKTTRVSVASNGVQANDASRSPAISANGLYVAFQSAASNLVHNDTNGVDDVFLHEIGEKPSPKPALLPATGFAPGRITTLSPSTAEIYSNLSMLLEIPTLKLNAAIVSVPKKGVSGWNVSGLGGNIGYLSGTVFPTQNGNAVLTGHLYDANGQPGPFINLEKMTRGQQIIIHANGRQYVYVVFAVKKWVSPSTTGFLANHESHPWLTLITCSGYNAKTNSYRWRTVVRATLVKTLNEP